MSPISLITLLLLIALYALAWHDKSGRQSSDAQAWARQATGQPHKEKENA